jgi:hypothetical protein
MSLNGKVFIRKSSGPKKYKWSPTDNDKVAFEENVKSTNRRFYCTAIIGSQGIDWIGTYSYEVVVNEQSIVVRTPYVACDYVE